ncbi:DUF973 family protein [Metallosphaera hakonensis]|nr:DUF973 family protein [Metallosphaera hakonensis]
MVIIGLFKVGSIYGEGLIKVGAILTIIPYLNLVAPFLLIFGLGNAIRKVQGGYSGQSTGPLTPPQFPGQSPGRGPQVYQVGVGSLDDNGVTRLTLYSASPMTLVSAILYTQSGPRVARSLTLSLSPGYNNVEMTFDTSPLPKGTYNVDITFSNGLSLRVLVVH